MKNVVYNVNFSKTVLRVQRRSIFCEWKINELLVGYCFDVRSPVNAFRGEYLGIFRTKSGHHPERCVYLSIAFRAARFLKEYNRECALGYCAFAMD